MEARCLYFTVHSASNLVDVRKLGEMKVYAKVSIAGKSKCTQVDLLNGTNPEWNTTFSFIVPEKNIIQGGGNILVKIELLCQRSFSHDKYVGELNFTLDSQCAKSCNTFSVYRGGSNKSSSFGTLKYSRVLGDKLIVVDSSSSEEVEDFARKIDILKIGVDALSAMDTIVKAFNSS